MADFLFGIVSSIMAGILIACEAPARAWRWYFSQPRRG